MNNRQPSKLSPQLRAHELAAANGVQQRQIYGREKQDATGG
jgi:hypothetical protein